ncbi:hypothetical protein E5676_scaffold352G006830 [Cucumis melo var. makuwa]|uniref:Uncharacterized protein n=2 Tax=Cucumis melo TaxID=3656 RepID=A0A5A7UD60_CUCMM|nr:hypothetical protein E6C27_scaffold135G002660 [Cucumis melo var. makuwa]TYK25531.1 hypothetical protein E5676_scaffold352G006830 [Cucumis melo var. makuwa]
MAGMPCNFFPTDFYYPRSAQPHFAQIAAKPLSKTVEDDREVERLEKALSLSSVAIEKKMVGASTSMAFLPPPSYILKQ